MALSISLAYLRNRKRQSVISIFGVIMGVAFFIAIASMMKGVHLYFIEKMIDVAPHVTIQDEFRDPPTQPVYMQYPESATELRGAKPKEELRGIRSAEKIVEALSKIQGVLVSPILQGQVFLRYGGKDVSSTLIGIKPELERLASNLERDMTHGDLNSLLTNTNGIILGTELAKKLAVKMGAKLSVISPAGIVKKMKVVGLFDTGVTEVDGSMSFAMLKKVQILQDRENVINQINLRLADIDSAQKIAIEIEERYKYRTESWQETFENIFEMFVIENAIMYSTVGAILLVAGFGIYNIISTTVNEKNKDIAILKSMGFSEADIRHIFLFQGVLVGVVGTIVGWFVGAALIEILASIPLDLTEEMPVEFSGFPMFRSIWLYIGGGVMAIAASSLSAYLPARKAASLNPVDIIRGAV